MAWNGRNESILGSKPISPLAADPTPKQVVDSSSSTTNAASSTESSTKTKPTSAATPPPPNAWNGRNTKIMEVRDNNISKEREVVAGSTTTTPLKANSNGKKEISKSASTAATKTNTPVVMMSVISKKPGEVVVNPTSCSSSTTTAISSTSPTSSSNNSNSNNIKVDDVKRHSKEDETTNSTSGSSTTNTTIEEDPTPALLEGNVVTTTVAVTEASSSNSKNSNNNNTEKVDSEEKKNSPPSSTNADVKLPPRSNSSGNMSNNSSNHRQNNHHHQQQQGRNNATSSESNHHVRRGNHRGGSSSGSRGNSNSNNTNSNHQSSGKNNNNNASRGNAASNGGRRRVNKSEMPICSFFLQGQCTRGTSCNFRHDPTAQQLPASSTPNNNNSMNTTVSAVVSPSNSQHRSSTRHPPAPVSNNNNQYMNAMATSFVPNKRVFDPYKARAIQMAKEAQDAEDRSSFASPTTIAKQISGEVEGTGGAISEEKKTEEIEDPPFFSIDVECVATGYGSCARGTNDGCGNEGRNREGVPSFQFNDRSHRYPGRVAMVDSDGNVVADIIIRPPKDGAGVLSYLTPLTGLTAEICLGPDAMSLEEAVDVIKAALPKNGVIIGQAIDHDVQWLGLTAGKDFDRIVDISEIFRQRMPSVLNEAVNAIKEKEEGGGAATDGSEEDKSSDKYLGFATRYRHFSLRHVCLNLLGEDIQSGIHDPIVDAKYSLLLFHKYRNSSVTQLRIVRDGLHRAPVTPGFAAEKTPVIEGVCVSRAGYPYKRAARKIWRWYSALKNDRQH